MLRYYKLNVLTLFMICFVVYLSASGQASTEVSLYNDAEEQENDTSAFSNALPLFENTEQQTIESPHIDEMLPFFNDSWEQGSRGDGSDYDFRRYRKVQLSDEITKAEGVRIGDVLLMNLFEDAVYRAEIDKASVNVNGTYTVRGRIIGHEYGYIIISTTGERSLAKIRIPEKQEMYLIKSDANALNHYLIDIGDENNHYLESAPPLITPEDISNSRRSEERDSSPSYRPGPEDYAFVDVLIVYTPAAATWADENGGGIDNVVAQTMALSELAVDNSNVLMDIFLAHSSLIEYEESGDSYTDIYRLAYSEDFDPWDREDGPPWYMDEVHDWRDEHQADLVAMLALVNDVGGLGWVLTSTEGRPHHGFSLTRVQQASRTYTFIHEIGHNMGCHHHRDQNTSPGPGIFDYSSGWRWTGNDNQHYCSVLTYESGRFFDDGINHTRVAYFSNPDINHQGTATGHPEYADNSRTIRETKHIIAGYRDAVIDTVQVAIEINDREEVVLSWEEVLRANSYRIYSSPDYELEFEDWTHIGTVDEPLFIDEDEPREMRFYRVVADRY